jgi:hypothetical protein
LARRRGRNEGLERTKGGDARKTGGRGNDEEKQNREIGDEEGK